MARSHGSSSFVMPLEGSGSVARPFCCWAGAWWPTLRNKANFTYIRTQDESWRVLGPAASEAAAQWPEVMAPLLL